jgi:7-cyano-7-deazaguanine reductase
MYPKVHKGLTHKKSPSVVKEKKLKAPHIPALSITEMQKNKLTKLGSANTQYKYNGPSASILETFVNKHQDQIFLVPFTQERDEFSALCPVTHQPDFARVEILYVPNSLMVESKSLKLYFFSFRNSGEFHEDVVNRICKDLWSVLKPKYLRVFGNFAARGGISIKPMVEKWDTYIGEKEEDWVTKSQIRRLVVMWDRKNLT